MKLIPVIAFAAIAAVAAAPHASAAVNCNRPAAVTVPDGKTAEEAAMQAANPKVVTFIKGANEFIGCLQKELNSIQAEAKKTSDEYKVSVDAYNAKATAANAAK